MRTIAVLYGVFMLGSRAGAQDVVEDKPTTLNGHKSWIHVVAFSPDSKLIASGSADKTVKLWDVASGKDIQTFSGDFYAQGDLAFSPDGKQLLATIGDRISVVNVGLRKEVKSLGGAETTIRRLRFSPDGKTLGAAYNEKIALWQIDTWKERALLPGHPPVQNGPESYYAVSALAYSRDGARLASGGADSAVRIWDARSGKELKCLKSHKDQVLDVVFSRDGKMLFSTGKDKTIKCWDVASGKELQTLSDHTEWIRSLALTPDGKYLMSAGYDCSIIVWEASGGKKLQTLNAGQQMNSVSISADGKLLAAGGGDSTVSIWKMKPAVATEDKK